MKHISEEEFFLLIDIESKSESMRKKYRTYYNKICNTWEDPEVWFKSETKTIYLAKTQNSNIYWVLWALKNKVSLPIEFINELKVDKSKHILKNTLEDFSRLETTFSELMKIYDINYLNKIYPSVLRICLFKGINSIKEISIENVLDAEKQGVISKGGYKAIVAKFLFYMAYIDEPIRKSILHESIMNQRIKISDLWSCEMKKAIERFIQNLWNSKIRTMTSEREKISDLNVFAKWLIDTTNLKEIENLCFLNRNKWLEYVAHIKNKNVSDKTKGHKLRTIKQFTDWAKVKEPQIVMRGEIIYYSDYNNLNKNNNVKPLAFDKREYGEKILYYLINEFKPKNIEEQFMKAAIIIAANSGMRISEIRNIEYQSCFYSEDEGLYKFILDYTDKLGQINRPVYITKDGYEAVKRVEDLRKGQGILKERYNKRLKRKYIHLFEYRGRSPINESTLYSFIERVKMDIGLVDDKGKIIKGGLHAFRHMFGMTMFREGGYNISVVRYLLGHRNYQMTYKYLEEEKSNLIEGIRNSENESEFSGGGLDTLIDTILNGNKKEDKELCKIIENQNKLSDLIELKKIKKVSFGYCLNPCENSNRCIRCKYFFVSKHDKDQLIETILNMFEIICFKKSLFTSRNEFLNDSIIEDDILDLEILISEVANLGINKEHIYELLKKGDIHDRAS